MASKTEPYAPLLRTHMKAAKKLADDETIPPDDRIAVLRRVGTFLLDCAWQVQQGKEDTPTDKTPLE